MHVKWCRTNRGQLGSYHPCGIVVRVHVVGEEAGEDEEPCQGEHWQDERCLRRSLGEDVETYQVSSSVQSRKATSSTVSRPGIWLAGEIRTWSWQRSSWRYGWCWRWCLIGISLTNLWHIVCLSMMQGRAPQMSPRSEVLHTGIFNSVSSQTSFRHNYWKSTVSLIMISFFSLVYLFLKAPNISRHKQNICERARAFITSM